MAIDTSKLNREQLAFFNHLTRPGSDHELIQRRDETRAGLTNGNRLGTNRQAATLALMELHERLNPAVPEYEQVESAEGTVIQIAQKLYDKGDDVGAKRVLTNAKMNMDYLSPRPNSEDFAARVKACRNQYQDKRHDAIKKLKQDHDWNDKQATDFFDGKHLPSNHDASLDTHLRKETNLSHSFPGDRPI